MECIYLVGNPTDGYKAVGPFKNTQDASKWVFDNNAQGWLLFIHNPIDFAKKANKHDR